MFVIIAFILIFVAAFFIFKSKKAKEILKRENYFLKTQENMRIATNFAVKITNNYFNDISSSNGEDIDNTSSNIKHIKLCINVDSTFSFIANEPILIELSEIVVHVNANQEDFLQQITDSSKNNQVTIDLKDENSDEITTERTQLARRAKKPNEYTK